MTPVWLWETAAPWSPLCGGGMGWRELLRLQALLLGTHGLLVAPFFLLLGIKDAGSFPARFAGGWGGPERGFVPLRVQQQLWGCSLCPGPSQPPGRTKSPLEFIIRGAESRAGQPCALGHLCCFTQGPGHFGAKLLLCGIQLCSLI